MKMNKMKIKIKMKMMNKMIVIMKKRKKKKILQQENKINKMEKCILLINQSNKEKQDKIVNYIKINRTIKMYINQILVKKNQFKDKKVQLEKIKIKKKINKK